MLMVCKLLMNKTSQVLVWLESMQLELLETLINEFLENPSRPSASSDESSGQCFKNESVQTVSLPLFYEQHVHSIRL